MITTPGNNRREKLTQLVDEPANQASQAPAKITIPQTTGNPKWDAAVMLEGR